MRKNGGARQAGLSSSETADLLGFPEISLKKRKYPVISECAALS